MSNIIEDYDGYKPPTEEEIKAYWESLTPEQREENLKMRAKWEAMKKARADREVARQNSED